MDYGLLGDCLGKCQYIVQRNAMHRLPQLHICNKHFCVMVITTKREKIDHTDKNQGATCDSNKNFYMVSFKGQGDHSNYFKTCCSPPPPT